MNARVTVPTYTPSPPWTDGQAVTRNTDGVLFTYSKSLNTLTINPNVSGAVKNAGNFIIQNLPSPVQSLDAANKAYVDVSGGGAGGIVEAPTDGGTYVRQNATWISTIDGGSSYTLRSDIESVDSQDYVETRAGISEAPTDGGTYARQNAAWTSTYDGAAY